MKKITLIFSAILSLFIMSCEGPQGFDGRDGYDGEDGVNILGSVIDIEGSFSLENDYSILYDFPQTVEVFETDIVLVYILWDQTEDSNGDPVDVWRLLPQTRLLDQGILQYNYDYTFFDVSIFLESDFDLGTLQSGDTDNQIFRIAIIPADLSASKLDTSNISTVMSALGVSEKQVQKVTLN